MKSILYIFKSGILFLILISQLSGVEMNWNHSYDEALSQAKIEHKIVYLFIGADRCKYCEKFKKMTLSKSEVIEKMERNFVLLFMSRDQHLVPDKFEKYGVPRHYFLNPKGEVIRTEQGIWDPQGWYSILDEVIADRDEVAQ
jgi:thiol:disulfide interchange protein